MRYRTPLPPGPFDPPPKEPPTLLGAAFVLVLLGVLAVLVAGLLGAVRYDALWDDGSPGEAQAQFPASPLLRLPQPVNDEWILPSAAVRLDGRTFVLDSGKRRVVAVDADGFAATVFEDTDVPGPPWPVAMTTDGRRLLIAAGDEVVVLDAGGHMDAVLQVRVGTPGERTPRLIGIAAGPDGRIIVSDAENHRVLFLDGDGSILKVAGIGVRADGRDGFNAPGALTVDRSGDIYVADVLNARIVKLSAEGRFLQEFGQPGVTAGTLSRPKGIAVDGRGLLYVTDGLQAAVTVFDPDGRHLGLIRGEGLIEAPAGLWLADSELYVIDRFAGLLMFRLP